jgi:hypothetical protein
MISDFVKNVMDFCCCSHSHRNSLITQKSSIELYTIYEETSSAYVTNSVPNFNKNP